MSFEQNLLEAKKEAFIDFVKDASKVNGLEKYPRVEFVEGYLENPNRLAEINIVYEIIYVSLSHLRIMHMEMVKKVAFHEVTHLMNPNHDPDFYKDLDSSLLAVWEPENKSGLHMQVGNSHHPVFKDEPLPINDKVCNRHDCNCEFTLQQCDYCEKFFCQTHIKPHVPTSMNGGQLYFYEYQHTVNCHACPPFYDYLREQEKIRDKQYAESLNALSKVHVIKEKTIKRPIKPQKIFNSLDEISTSGCDICRKMTGVKRCRYCGQWHCDKHSTPKLYNTPRIDGGHSCKKYTEQRDAGKVIPTPKEEKPKLSFWQRWREKRK